MTAYDVSSGFLSEIVKSDPTIVRKFTIGTSDYSEFVTKWPTIKRRWNLIKPQNTTLALANHTGDLNFIQEDVANLGTSVEAVVAMGVQYAVGSEETLDLFTGIIGKASYKDALCNLTLYDKVKFFSDLVIGTNTDPIDLTTSNFSVGCMGWTFATDYGGLSDIRSTSNPDIDYASFVEWASVFSSANTFVKGFFTGQRVTELFRKLGRLTHSSIVVENNKLVFNRFSTSSTAPYDPGSQAQMNQASIIDERRIRNTAVVLADYDITSRYFKISISDKDAASVNSFGNHQLIESDNALWFVDSVSALDLAQRLLSVDKLPYLDWTVGFGLQPLPKQIGDTILLEDPVLGKSGETARIMEYAIDMERAQIKIFADASQLQTFFVLDDPTNGLLDQSYNPLG